MIFSKNKSPKKLNFNRSKKPLLAFVIAFAVTGGAYLAYRSFAYTNTTVVATFVSYVNAKTRLYTLTASGQMKELTAVTNSYVSPRDPDLSNNGQRIVFSSSYGLRIIDSNGANLRTLTPDHRAGYPSFSPSGNKIAYYDNKAKGGGIYVMNADGTGKRRLLAVNGIYGSKIKWSSDGKYIMSFVPENYTNNIKPGLYRINTKTASYKRLITVTNFRYGYYLHDVSVNKILYSQTDRVEDVKRLQTLRVDGTGGKTLTRLGKWSSGTAVFSPNASTAFFIEYSDAHRLLKVNVDSKRVSSVVADWNPSHQDDIQNIAYTGDKTSLIVFNTARTGTVGTNQFVLVKPDGTSVSKIFWQPQATYSIWGPGF